jgi:hypothetical protein
MGLEETRSEETADDPRVVRQEPGSTNSGIGTREHPNRRLHDSPTD